MPPFILLSYRETGDPEILRHIVDHKSDEPRVGRERNNQRGQDENAQAPRARLNYRRARMESAWKTQKGDKRQPCSFKDFI